MAVPVDSMGSSNSRLKKSLSRRDFLKIAGLFSLDVILGAAVSWNYIDKIEPNWIEITNVALKLPRLPKSFSGFRLVQVSDIHLGRWMSPERFAPIADLVMAQSPDLVVMTGDFVLAYKDAPVNQTRLGKFTEILKTMTRQTRVISIMGNHDHWFDFAVVKDTLELGGSQVLINAVTTLERDDGRLHIAGLDDVYEGKDDLQAVLATLPGDGAAILLTHEPDFADVSAETGRFDLQVSGHSHGGQVVIPLFGPLVLPRLGRKYPAGLYQVKDMYQYTNRGVGMTAPSVRFNCRPEITVFTLESV